MTYEIKTPEEIDRIRDMLTESAFAEYTTLDRKYDKLCETVGSEAEEDAQCFIPDGATDVTIRVNCMDRELHVHYTIPLDKATVSILDDMKQQRDDADTHHDEVSERMTKWAARATKQLLAGEPVEMPPGV